MNVPNPTQTPPESFVTMLKESVHHFLFRQRNSDFTAFYLTFRRVFQTFRDPPLEATWLNSALSYHYSKSTLRDPSKGLSISNELIYPLISGCSGYDDSIKVAALVPVLYELYNLLHVPQFCSGKEIMDSVEMIIDYIKIHRSNHSEANVVCFFDLVRVWTADRVDENSTSEEMLRMCLPLVSQEIRQRFREVNGVGYIAGIVMIEAFLLRFHFKFETSLPDDEYLNYVGKWAVQTIQGFRSYYFLDMLFRMLLEPSLPVTTISSPGDELLIRKLSYDAVIFEGHLFIYSGNLTDQPDEDALINLSVLWLFVVNTAIQVVSQNGDYTRATKYTDAFAISEIPVRLIKWVTSRITDDCISGPKISTPKALIKWLLGFQELGNRISEDNVLNLLAENVVNLNQEGAYLENDEDQEMVDISTRKRQGDCLVSEGLTHFKLLKYN